MPRAAPALRGGVWFPQDAHLDPARLVRALAERASARGARIATGHEVLGFERAGRRIAKLVDHARRLLRRPGRARRAARGRPCSPRSSVCACRCRRRRATASRCAARRTSPTCRILLSEAKVAVTPIGDTLRFAGTLELAGVDLSVNVRRVARDPARGRALPARRRRGRAARDLARAAPAHPRRSADHRPAARAREPGARDRPRHERDLAGTDDRAARRGALHRRAAEPAARAVLAGPLRLSAMELLSVGHSNRSAAELVALLADARDRLRRGRATLSGVAPPPAARAPALEASLAEAGIDVRLPGRSPRRPARADRPARAPPKPRAARAGATRLSPTRSHSRPSRRPRRARGARPEPAHRAPVRGARLARVSPPHPLRRARRARLEHRPFDPAR